MSKLENPYKLENLFKELKDGKFKPIELNVTSENEEELKKAFFMGAATFLATFDIIKGKVPQPYVEMFLITTQRDIDSYIESIYGKAPTIPINDINPKGSDKSDEKG